MPRVTLLRICVLALALAPLALALPALVDEPAPEPARPTGRIDLVEAGPVLGFAIVAHHIGDIDLYLESVDRIAELGANALVIVTPMFQEKVDSTDIRFLPDRCPTDDQLVAIFKRARRRGLLTTLQPIVLIADPDDDDWRGVIRPADWDAWWTSYDAFIDRFVKIAVDADVDALAVGSELNSTEKQPERWKAIIDRVRGRFDGRLTYSANWDRYDKVDFWPLVDVISVSSYFELRRNEPGATEADIAADWSDVRRNLLAFAAKWQRPLILSEVGYPSLPWANAHPWNYVADGSKADHDLQARCWRAFFTAWSGPVADPRQPVLGFFCYYWDPYHRGGPNDTGYGVNGKPAAGVIRRGLAGIREKCAD